MALSFGAYEYAILLWQMLDLSGEDREKAKKMLKEYHWILSFGKSSRTRLVHLAVSLLGLEGTAKLLDWYMTRK